MTQCQMRHPHGSDSCQNVHVKLAMHTRSQKICTAREARLLAVCLLVMLSTMTEHHSLCLLQAPEGSPSDLPQQVVQACAAHNVHLPGAVALLGQGVEQLQIASPCRSSSGAACQ